MSNKPNEFELFPFIHSFSNMMKEEDSFASIRVPDKCPSDILDESADFSMVAGEFCEVYRPQVRQWDCVCTCFFIDTAHNVIEYIEVISQILKPGGLWVNFGPLLYHYSEQSEEVSLELSWEEIKNIIPKFGFTIKECEVKDSPYCHDSRSMMQLNYKCIFFTCVKNAQ